VKAINFIPDSVIQARARRRLIVRSFVMLACLAAAMGAWFKTSRMYDPAPQDTYLASLETQIAAMLEQSQEIAARQKQHRERSEEVAVRERIAAPLPATFVIAAVVETLPPSIGLSSLSLVDTPVEPIAKHSREAATGSAPHPNRPLRVHIEGLAPDDVTIAKVLGRLDERPPFGNVELGYSRPLEGAELMARAFRITAEIPLDRRYIMTGQARASDAR